MSVEKHLDSVTAVLIHADSTVFTGDGMDYTLSTLSTILPKTLANNIAFVFTNVSTPSLQGFSVPEVFKGAPTFVFDDPAVPRRKYLNHRRHLKDGPQPSKDEVKKVQASDQSALEMLAELFNWMDSLNLQPATEVVYLFEKYQNIKATVHTATQMDRAMAKKEKIDKLMTRLKENSTVRLSSCSYLSLESYARWT